MKSRLTNPLFAFALLGAVATASAQSTIVYDNFIPGASGLDGDYNSTHPIFGSPVTLTQGGTLSAIGLMLWNPQTGGNGSILTGTMQINFYDNSSPYTGGVLASLPLWGTANVTWDFTAGGGLAPGAYATKYFDLTAFNITVPQDIFVTQQFTETSGSSLLNGVAFQGVPLVGASPDQVYIKTDGSGENLFTGYRVGYSLAITSVPEPSTLAMSVLGGLALLLKRRRRA
jgi:hypothetical protein